MAQCLRSGSEHHDVAPPAFCLALSLPVPHNPHATEEGPPLVLRSGKLITRVDRYIFHQLALALVAVTGGLTALVWLIQSLRFVELVVNHGLSLGVFVELTSLLIPSVVAVILPITTFVVVQFIYQRLAGDREITVMRAAGLSPFALARPALAVAGIAVVC